MHARVARLLPRARAMTEPRQILPGTTYLVTRRCTQREFLLKPSPVTNGVFLYVLAVAAERFGILVHAFCVLSNHFHLIVTDPEARLPAFEQYLDSLVARALNAALGRSEDFWGPPTYSAVALLSRDDVVDKAVYVLANPVAAGLVSRGCEWPGLWSDLGAAEHGRIDVERPTVFFRPGGKMPDTISLQLTAPPGFDSFADFRSCVTTALAAREEQLAHVMAAAGKAFLGVARVLGQDATARASTREPLRQLNPRIASRDTSTRIDGLNRLVEFRLAYREAWAKLKAGVRDVVFPAGTYWLRVAYGVRCALAG
jgi:putative transposase